MKFIETKFFIKQLNELSNKYPKIYDDFHELKEMFNTNYSTHLGEGIYKERFKNSSVPIGKRGGFRFIIKVYGDIALPLLVYSKSMKSNISKEEILFALNTTIKELS